MFPSWLSASTSFHIGETRKLDHWRPLFLPSHGLDAEKVEEQMRIHACMPEQSSFEIILSQSKIPIELVFFFMDFSEDGDIFSTVGDRADHPEAGSERDTRPGGAGSECQTGGTHTLRPCASIPWIRKPVEWKDRSRTDIYYFVEGGNVRLRSFNEIQKYCKDNNIDYDQNLFNFSGKSSSSGKVADILNLPLKEKANLAEVRIPKTYREATRTPEAADWEGAMDKEMQVMEPRRTTQGS
ncbi:retrovirus-related Pol polyprotein from transposon TNT 1-94 [Trichonephila inaurata madagascariensis]|uniref:Retrovirus-related Pol polyprotein from transposon TNT 1-94 n=1 Tax=Trichonephila inaurata madagascariensis TaxID=2747483 RepID=A0A8X6X5I0_9ARAC|nr:retrovirus-related Pol polyprotein from transposon TNT 1-94 [Trichonephila inaurata madagascariensis]